MSGHRDEHLDLCAAWALGVLDEADRARFEQHLDSGCPECERAMTRFSSDTLLLARSAGARAPSRSLRDRVLIAAGSSRPGNPSARDDEPRIVPIPHGPPRGQVWFATAAAAALLVFAGLEFDRADRLGQQLEDERRWNAVATAPGARVAEFELTPEGEAALRGRAFYDPHTRSAVFVFEHAGPPRGHDYELWAIRGGKPAALGVLKADAAGRATVRVEDAGAEEDLAAFAVSLERAGGSLRQDQPGGPVIMMGKLGS